MVFPWEFIADLAAGAVVDSITKSLVGNAVCRPDILSSAALQLLGVATLLDVAARICYEFLRDNHHFSTLLRKNVVCVDVCLKMIKKRSVFMKQNSKLQKKHFVYKAKLKMISISNCFINTRFFDHFQKS